MSIRVFPVAVVLACLFAALTYAQDLTVSVVKVRTLTTSRTVKTTKVIDEIGAVLSSVEIPGPESEPAESAANVVKVETEAANVRVTAEDAERNRVAVKKLDDGRYGLGSPAGRVWVRVSVIDFQKNIWAEETVVVEPVTPPKPPTPDVDDKYGVGKVAATFAPDHPGTRAIVASQYKQAADFLFGIPTLKAVSSANGNDVNNNVFAWLRNEASKMKCPDPVTCGKWKEFRTEVAKALEASQRNRQFTRDDWYNAFNEIARAIK